ncbi:limbin isoform X2 [Dasypus novemcinctus]|uniref:limbin isoform X2 n=1 Tax=Dasypus novemcinctus TaxID=9361 RepID=UPI00265E75F2|nr:limbin isoform X3 [Dasypus novemcinctus]
MGLTGAPGCARLRASWVLVGGLLAAALVLPAGPGVRGWPPAGPGPYCRLVTTQSPPDPPVAGPGPGTLLGRSSAGLELTVQALQCPIWRCMENSHLHTTVAVAFGMEFTEKVQVYKPLPTSAASSGPWTHSIFAFISSWTKKTLFKRESSRTHYLHGDVLREFQRTSESGVIFQKCAVVSGQSERPAAQVRLLVNNTRSPLAANLSDLLLLDNITGLTVHGSIGNKTSEGFQAFRKKFLQVGDTYAVGYSAWLEAGSLRNGETLMLPAQLAFQTSSPNRTQLKALFTITVEEEITVLPNHGLHAAGFFIAFMLSLGLTWVTLVFVAQCQCLKGTMLNRHRVQHHESKLEHSQFTSASGVNEDLALNDQMIDILSLEDPGSMLQALEDLEIATLNQADSDLEACRTHISRDIIALLLRNLTSSGHLSPQVERKMCAVFKKQFLLLENEIQEEYDRKMVALTAECDLEARKRTEIQYQREMAAMEEAEELLKRASERSAGECGSLLRAAHGLEQDQLRRSLALQQDEDLAKARRQLAIFQRNELHRIFFTQIKSALLKGELKPEAAKMLLQDYSQAQAKVEELMDFFQATKRYHLSKRFGHREYLVHNMRSSETRGQGLLSTAAAQLSQLIQRHERAGYLDEDQMEMLLERAQTEVFSIKQKLDNDLKQEKKKLHQKLILKRRREMLQKHKEQRKEQLSIGEAFHAVEDVSQYLGRWRSLMAEHSAALEELQERLDQAALDELRARSLSLSEKGSEELRRLQNTAMTQELLKRSVPWLFLQQILEEHGQEMAARAEQLEGEERARSQEGVQSVRQRLKADAPEAAMEEQAELRHWEHLVFMKLCSSAFSLSEEQLLWMRQEAHGCFAQMDRSLALPKTRARVLLQQLQTAWQDAEFLKLDQALAAPELQQQSKVRKQRSKSRSKVDLLKKCIEDKIHLLEEQAPEDLAEKELQELERKLEDELVQQEAAQQQQALESWQQWMAEGPGLPSEPGEEDSGRQVSSVLWRALSESQVLLEQHQQSLREEQQKSVVLEDLLENMEIDTFMTLYGQELRLASYLAKLAAVPGGTLRRLLTVALPAAWQPELLAALDVGSDSTLEAEGGGERADLARRRKHQDWWQSLESRLRGDLISRGLEKMLWARGRKESILKKVCLPLTERMGFSGKGSWPHLSLEPIGEPVPLPVVGAEAIDLLNTGEKLFIFRNPKEPEISLHAPPRKKKKNFLNAKKATWASSLD